MTEFSTNIEQVLEMNVLLEIVWNIHENIYLAHISTSLADIRCIAIGRYTFTFQA